MTHDLVIPNGTVADGTGSPLREADLDDLPAGGRRLLQDADGYRHTFVSGVAIMRDGEPTGNLPGRLVRSTAG